MKERFKEKWTRTPSNKLTTSIRAEVNKFQNIIDTATSADVTVRQKFDTHRAAIVTLGKDETSLESSLPKAGAQSAISSGSQVSSGSTYTFWTILTSSSSSSSLSCIVCC